MSTKYNNLKATHVHIDYFHGIQEFDHYYIDHFHQHHFHQWVFYTIDDDFYRLLEDRESNYSVNKTN